MSKKLLLSLASVGVLSAVTFVTFQGNNGGLRSSVVRPAVEIPAYSCAYYVPSIEAYYDLAGNSFSSQDESGNYSAVYDVTETTITTNQHGITPLCTPEEIAKYGSIGEDGLFVAYGTTGSGDSDGDTTSSGSNGVGNGSDGTSIKQPSKLETLLTAWNDAKTTLANLETELKTLTDSKKTLTDRKAVLEKKTGTDSIAAVTARLAAIEKELAVQLTKLTKNTKLKSAEEYEPAKAQALADFNAIDEEMRLFMLGSRLGSFKSQLAGLKRDLAELTKIKPQTTQTKDAIKNKNNGISVMNQAIAYEEARIAEIQKRKTAAATKYKTLQAYETKYIYPFRTKTSALNKEKTELTQKLSGLTAELSDIKTKLGERLPALPGLIEKQKTLVAETQKTYTDYVATLPKNGTGTGTGDGNNGECNTTTGENCDGGGGGNGTGKSCCVGFYGKDENDSSFEGKMKNQCQAFVSQCDKGTIFPDPGGVSLQNDMVLNYCDGTAVSRLFGGGKFDEIKTTYCGHSDDMTKDPELNNVCDPAKAVKEQILTVSISGKPVPSNIEYFNSGCMTYNNLNAARASAESLQDFLKTSGYGGTVVISGYQNKSCAGNALVGGLVQYIVCSSSVTEQFVPCPEAGSDCYVDSGNSSFQCDRNGSTVTMSCNKKTICLTEPNSTECDPYDGVHSN